MSSKYVDNSAITQVIGTIYNDPHILDFNDKYSLTEYDFPDNFYKVIYGVIYKLYEGGATSINLNNIHDYLNSRPNAKAIFNTGKGEEWLTDASQIADKEAFNYYYNRVKKMTLLRAYDDYGVDMKWLLDMDNILDSKKRQEQEDLIDSLSIIEIAEQIDKRIDEIKLKCADTVDTVGFQSADDIENLLEDLQQRPEVGISMYGSMMNAITRGARLKKFYLLSAPSGYGKSRSLIANACTFACDKIYNDQLGCWLKTGSHQPTLYITTELDKQETQTMILAFISGVNEDHILNWRFEGDEEKRVKEAAKLLKDVPLYIEVIPDFSLQDIENCIKRNIRDHDVSYICFDYIHTSMKILEEITRRSGGIKLREDNILFMLSTRLKDLCNKYGIFILSATQVSSNWKEDTEMPDQNLLRGAKSIADKIDVGMLLLPVTQEDRKALQPVLDEGLFENPTLKISVYKNRRGKYKGMYLWCTSDLGTCRIDPIFATDWSYELMKVNDLKISVESPIGAF